MNFKNKVVVITGASSGIGEAAALKFSKKGAKIVLVARRKDKLLEVENKIKEFSQSTLVCQCDVSNKEEVDLMSKIVLDKFGRIDILVNNAGLMRRGTITDTTDEDYNLSMSVNVEAPFRIVRAAIPLMAAAGGGAIVNTSSCWGINPGPNHLIYCTTKAALAAMTQCLGRDHAHQNIRINAVCPNEVNTSMLRTGFEIRGLNSDAAINELNKSVPLGHIAEPEEIANVIAFLTSDEAGYICGSLVEVNGGKAVY